MLRILARCLQFSFSYPCLSPASFLRVVENDFLQTGEDSVHTHYLSLFVWVVSFPLGPAISWFLKSFRYSRLFGRLLSTQHWEIRRKCIGHRGYNSHWIFILTQEKIDPSILSWFLAGPTKQAHVSIGIIDHRIFWWFATPLHLGLPFF